MFKSIFLFIIYILSIVIFIPSFTVSVIRQNNTNNNSINEEEKSVDIVNNIDILGDDNNVKINNENKTLNIEHIPFEDYIVGVVAAEMPISFEEEALKAQAVAARTYAYKRVDNINEKVDHKSIGQAYNDINQLKSKWGDNFDKYYNKVLNSVYATKGVVMTYQNEPIEAVFHSTSAGTTEVSENIWGKNLPYIKNVDSKVDENAPNFIYTTKVSKDKIISEISKKFPKIDKSKIIDNFKITKRSNADYVLEVDILGNKITGREIRTMFKLRSTNFTTKKTNEGIEFTTKGYGHGAGMSQYGANFMAQDGKSYIDILNHYYVGVSLDKVY